LIKAGDPVEQARIVSLRMLSLAERALPRQADLASFDSPAGSCDDTEPPFPADTDARAHHPAQFPLDHPPAERGEFEATIVGLRQQLDRAREEADQREESAFERGLREGREEAGDHAEKRTALLAEALTALQQDQSARIAEMELLALQLAKAALGRIIGDPAQRSALIADVIAHHLSRIRRDLVLAIRFSAEDFAAPEQWAALAEAHPAIALERDSTLASGECAASLKLGTLDLGLAGQWQRLCELFESLAEAEHRP
jgi:type III secretion protein L